MRLYDHLFAKAPYILGSQTAPEDHVPDFHDAGTHSGHDVPEDGYARVKGKPMIAIVVCHSGTPEQAAADLASIKAHGTPLADLIQVKDYVAQQTLLDATQPKGRRYYWKSEYLPRIEPALYQRVVEHAARIRSPSTAIESSPSRISNGTASRLSS